MSSAQIPRGTIIKIAPINSGDRVFPEGTLLTVGPGGANVADTSIPVTLGTAITRTIKAPFWLLFTDTNGNEDLIKVTADVAPGATSLTVSALKRDLAVGATAPFPVLLRAREGLSYTNDDTQQDIMTFDNDGHKDHITTMLGEKVTLNGYYSPLDAGWNTVNYCRDNFKELYLSIEFPAPAPQYTKGEIIKGFVGVAGVPRDAGNVSDIIKSNLEFTYRGRPTKIDPS